MNNQNMSGSVLCNAGYISLVAGAIVTTAGLGAASGADGFSDGFRGIWPFIIGGSALSISGMLLLTWGTGARVSALADEVSKIGDRIDEMERNNIHLREVDDLINMNNAEVRRREFDDRLAEIDSEVERTLGEIAEIRKEIQSNQKIIEVRGTGGIRRPDANGG